MRISQILMSSLLVGVVGLAACGGDDDDDSSADDADASGPLGGSLDVTGTVVDFVSKEAVTGTVTVATEGVSPAPEVQVGGADFQILGVPENSIFHVYAVSEPGYKDSYSSVVVTTEDVSGVQLPVVSQAYVSKLASDLGVELAETDAVLLAQVVDANGAPRAGVSATSLTLSVAGTAKGPFVLDEQLQAAPNAKVTASKGWLVWFAVEPGLIGMTAAPAANVTVDMPLSPTAAGAATFARVKVEDGKAAPPPANVSFSQQIVPIFTRRGCVGCHSGNGPGKDLGGLQLDGGVAKIYKEVREEDPTRVVLATPETSLILTKPSQEDPPDGHPNSTFASKQDPDYQLILAWIKAGALNN